jgi:hypothetical protein
MIEFCPVGKSLWVGRTGCAGFEIRLQDGDSGQRYAEGPYGCRLAVRTDEGVLVAERLRDVNVEADESSALVVLSCLCRDAAIGATRTVEQQLGEDISKIVSQNRKVGWPTYFA